MVIFQIKLTKKIELKRRSTRSINDFQKQFGVDSSVMQQATSDNLVYVPSR